MPSVAPGSTGLFSIMSSGCEAPRRGSSGPGGADRGIIYNPPLHEPRARPSREVSRHGSAWGARALSVLRDLRKTRTRMTGARNRSSFATISH